MKPSDVISSSGRKRRRQEGRSFLYHLRAKLVMYFKVNEVTTMSTAGTDVIIETQSYDLEIDEISSAVEQSRKRSKTGMDCMCRVNVFKMTDLLSR